MLSCSDKAGGVGVETFSCKVSSAIVGQAGRVDLRKSQSKQSEPNIQQGMSGKVEPKCDIYLTSKCWNCHSGHFL